MPLDIYVSCVPSVKYQLTEEQLTHITDVLKEAADKIMTPDFSVTVRWVEHVPSKINNAPVVIRGDYEPNVGSKFKNEVVKVLEEKLILAAKVAFSNIKGAYAIRVNINLQHTLVDYYIRT